MGGTNPDGSIDRPPGKVAVFYLVVGWTAAVVSLVRFPFLFGLVSVIMGILANRQGSRAAMSLIAASIVLMAVGLIFNGVFYNNLRQALNL